MTLFGKSPANFVFLLFARHNVSELTSALTHSSVQGGPRGSFDGHGKSPFKGDLEGLL